MRVRESATTHEANVGVWRSHQWNGAHILHPTGYPVQVWNDLGRLVSGLKGMGVAVIERMPGLARTLMLAVVATCAPVQPRPAAPRRRAA